jgi:subtilisin family serine protease
MTRDVGYYAVLATLISLGTALLLGLVAWMAARAANAQSRWPLALAGAAGVGLLAIYVFVGQPGFHGEKLYVILKDQADLSAATASADPAERRAFVYQTLTRHADETQADLRSALDSARIGYTPYYLVNALEVDAGPFIRLWLEARPEVDRVLDSPALRPLPELPPMIAGDPLEVTSPLWSQQFIGAPLVWEQFDVRGTGIVIGQSDSGVDGQHPELREQYRGNRPGGPAGDDYNWLDPWNGTTSPTDLGGHGTHTLGSALGRAVGIAPDATWIGCVNLARNLGNAPRYLDCLQFLLAPFPQGGDPFHDGRPELGAHVFNNSWGCPEIEGCDATALLPAVRALRAAGVFVVASAGNSGSACGTISAPIALYDEVFTVGAIDEGGVLAPFSSRGPVTVDGSGRVKPDIVAPGVNILSSYPGGGYAYNQGTSMAGPHVAGVVALMWSANPALIGDIDQTEQILIETAQDYNDEALGVPQCGEAGARPDNATGFGIVDAYAAVKRALAESGQ